LNKVKRYILALDLKNDLNRIEEYKRLHNNVWPEIEASILNSGIELMEIYQISNRLVMIIEANDNFSFDKKSEMDAKSSKVQEWETLMWKYQQALPGFKKGEKWILMNKIYEIEQN